MVPGCVERVVRLGSENSSGGGGSAQAWGQARAQALLDCSKACGIFGTCGGRGARKDLRVLLISAAVAEPPDSGTRLLVHNPADA